MAPQFILLKQIGRSAPSALFHLPAARPVVPGAGADHVFANPQLEEAFGYGDRHHGVLTAASDVLDVNLYPADRARAGRRRRVASASPPPRSALLLNRAVNIGFLKPASAMASRAASVSSAMTERPGRWPTSVTPRPTTQNLKSISSPAKCRGQKMRLCDEMTTALASHPIQLIAKGRWRERDAACVSYKRALVVRRRAAAGSHINIV